HAVDRVDVPGVGREADVEVLDGQARSAVRLGHADTSCCGALRRPRRERRVRRRGSLRSLMDSPTRVTPSTARAIARPGNTPVHQMPLVASAIARWRSYPHSEALVGSIPKPRNPSAARVRIDSEAFSVKISGRVRVIFTRSEEHTSELQSRFDLVCRLLLEKKKIALYLPRA